MSPSKVPANHTSVADSFNQICRVRIELLDTDPLIWREVEVPTSIMLKVLHDVVQVTMGWLDLHLWEFTIDDRTYGLPMDEVWGATPRIEAIKIRLGRHAKGRPHDDRLHLRLRRQLVASHRDTKIRHGLLGVSYPHYLGGEWDCPPEDCGGVPTYYTMLDALADLKHPDHTKVAEEGKTGTSRRSTCFPSAWPSDASPTKARSPHQDRQKSP